jgi:hypothetical protein
VFPSHEVMERVTHGGGNNGGNGLRLKMVDIDTLQRAMPIYAAAHRGQGSVRDAGAARILPPLAALGQPAFNASLVFNAGDSDDADGQDGDGGGSGAGHRSRAHAGRRFSVAVAGAPRLPPLENFDLVCRCFYCRGRSNCLFANSFEGYRACGQHGGGGTDAGNAEPRELKMQKAAAKKRQCTLLTDSWYLGQLLFFLLRGELLFPQSMDMRSVIEAIDAALAASSPSAAAEALFKHSGGATASENGDHGESFAVFKQIIASLLLERVSPEHALEKLQPLLQRHGVASSAASSCPGVVDTAPFDGLRIRF